jgi:crotonobetaine/carnitine-CoA ligase
MTAAADIPRRETCVVGPLLERWAREQPRRNFLEFSDGTAWTFAEMRMRALRAAAGLRALGVTRGSHVLSWMPNEREAILGWFGANLLGAVYVPLNTAYRGAILRHAVALSDAKVLIAHASLLPRLEAESASLLDHIVCAGGPPPPIAGPRMHAFDVLEQPGSAEAEQPVQPWDANYIILTSGTTGPSKAVVCTYIQAWAGGAMAMDYFGQDDRLLANLPLFHVSGVGAVMDRLIKGGTCVLYDGFKPESFWDTVRRFNITGCCLVGAMTRFLLNQPPSSRDRDHPLRAVITVPWNQDSLAVAQRFGIEMHTAFNMTELATPIRSPANPPVLGTCGRARPGVACRIVDQNDMEVAPGTVGELILRTSRPWEITQGYYKDPEATMRAWRNGWFHTGDAFRCDEQGNFFFVDRLKDAIRRRGENISSFEVESEAGEHPDVREAAAIPVPSELGEDEVMLVVAPVAGRTVDPVELLRFMEPRLAAFMLPRYIRAVADLPKTPTAKVEKHRLRSEGITADTWDREAHGVTVRRGKLQTG